jgi:hypothetical protein
MRFEVARLRGSPWSTRGFERSLRTTRARCPLLKSFRRAIIAPNPLTIWRMSDKGSPACAKRKRVVSNGTFRHHSEDARQLE